MNKQIAKVDRVKAGSISQFIDRHYRHFNAAVLKDAADAYVTHLDRGGKMMRECRLKKFYEIDPGDSWMMAAAQKDLPLFVPGWEDSTLGNIYAARCITGAITDVHTVRSGIEYMIELAEWYRRVSQDSSIGFFQIGGGIAGDFPICVVPMLNQDVVSTPVPEWGYFCPISDSTTSFRSYSGAVPNEKITWGKLGVDTPRYIIESDATIVAPLMFAKILGW